MSVEITLSPPQRSEQELQSLIGEARFLFDDSTDPVGLLSWFGVRLGVGRIAVAVSFSDGVMACLGAKALPGVDLLFADTGYHFAETLGLRDAIAAVHPVNVRSLRPDLTVAEQDHRYGEDLWQRDPDLCCAMRKTAPMANALRNYDAWATGLRRSDHSGRADTPLVEWDDKHGIVKINPLAAFTDDMIDACIEKYQIMHNPLRELGYRSIGCSPCTRPVTDGGDARSGRWQGRAKVECGLHL
ncbi:MAG: phosphoadenylyl-sulfate reductase [Candidatus Nanopelagicales bacterium]